MKTEDIERAYELARERYAELGVDTEAALRTLAQVSLALPCWQGDDVRGFETAGDPIGVHRRSSAAENSGGPAEASGLRTTGNYPGRARTADELRQDMLKALSLIPGKHRVNLHAMYGEFGGEEVDRNDIEPRHFAGWMDWAKQHDLKLDLNATLFNHPRAAAGFTLSSKDEETRRFWIEHVRRCRVIAAEIGKAQSEPCYHNLWIPDGMKDICVNRGGFRQILLDSLDSIFRDQLSPAEVRDSVEPKLFGIGSESFVAGSFEFYLGFALSRGVSICLDTGHFHPTESVADKLSSILLFSKEVVLHLSRGVRWDSDHVPILDDPLRELCKEIVRNNALGRVHLALDFLDTSINRVGAWVIGTRAVLKGLLAALLEPTNKLKEYEESGDYFSRLALLEETKSLPFGAVWDCFCLKSGVPAGEDWISDILAYEREVLSRR